MQVVASKRLDAPADKTWQLLSDLGKIPEWADNISSVEVKGGSTLKAGVQRTLRFEKAMKGQESITEKVIEVDDNAFSYEITDAPKPFLVSRRAWMVHPEGDGCRVQVIGTAIPDGIGGRLAAPIHRMQMKRRMKGMLDGLAQHLEDGAGAKRGKGAKAKPSSGTAKAAKASAKKAGGKASKSGKTPAKGAGAKGSGKGGQAAKKAKSPSGAKNRKK